MSSHAPLVLIVRDGWGENPNSEHDRFNAVRLAMTGVPIFPLRPRRKEPVVSGGLHAATSDPDVVRAWWMKWPISWPQRKRDCLSAELPDSDTAEIF